eukprot:TRINITY_DN3215_c0_g2_i1.p2 TRINITY_DN3215_c0_g2~~TRINITY_DN3215_c0_g2_i1.p2  ORF type:complete len:260 (+),score=74.95 TRINITY_DN3215_c0_g2_i1:52-831(+)
MPIQLLPDVSDALSPRILGLGIGSFLLIVLFVCSLLFFIFTTELQNRFFVRTIGILIILLIVTLLIVLTSPYGEAAKLAKSNVFSFFFTFRTGYLLIFILGALFSFIAFIILYWDKTKYAITPEEFSLRPLTDAVIIDSDIDEKNDDDEKSNKSQKDDMLEPFIEPQTSEDDNKEEDQVVETSTRPKKKRTTTRKGRKKKQLDKAPSPPERLLKEEPSRMLNETIVPENMITNIESETLAVSKLVSVVDEFSSDFDSDA